MTDREYERTWKFRSSMFVWRMKCAGFDIREAFRHLLGIRGHEIPVESATNADASGSRLV